MKEYPIIAIAGDKTPAPTESVFKNFERHYSCDSFVQSIRQANGISIILPIIKNFSEKEIELLVNTIDGLILPGGEDIDPLLYKEEKQELCGKTDIETDLFQIALLRETLKQKKPILGICKGNQLINVAFKGSLIQDISNSKTNHKNLDSIYQGCHNIIIKEDSPLNRIFNLNSIKVNSLHHQVINKIGEDLKIGALSEDGYIESVYLDNEENFCLGVQWHPESMNEDFMKKLFRYFINLCR